MYPLRFLNPLYKVDSFVIPNNNYNRIFKKSENIDYIICTFRLLLTGWYESEAYRSECDGKPTSNQTFQLIVEVRPISN